MFDAFTFWFACFGVVWCDCLNGWWCFCWVVLLWLEYCAVVLLDLLFAVCYCCLIGWLGLLFGINSVGWIVFSFILIILLWLIWCVGNCWFYSGLFGCLILLCFTLCWWVSGCLVCLSWLLIGLFIDVCIGVFGVLFSFGWYCIRLICLIVLSIYFVCCVTFVCVDLIWVFNDLLCICCDFGWDLFCWCVPCDLWVILMVMIILF